MPRRLAVAIGVATVPGLPHLAGVRQGLDDFTAWATGQGFTVTTHDDAVAPVVADAVVTTVEDAVLAGDVERLVIFFGGHGFATGSVDDLWLLSGAARRPGEAIDVARSSRLARHCGIPHVVLLADACRTPPEARFLGLVGQPIFPLEKIPNTRVQVDEFYAAQSGDPALERGPAAGAEAFGFFSRCLLDALQGKRDEILTAVGDGPASHALLADSLADYLWSAVPALSAEQAGVTQYPDLHPTSAWQPNALAWFDRSATSPAPLPVPMPAPGPTTPPSGTTHLGSAIEQPAETIALQPPAAAAFPGPAAPAPSRTPWRPSFVPERYAEITRLAETIVALPGRSHFETRVGATVHGAEVLEAWVEGKPAPAFEEDDAWHVRGVPDQAGAAFLKLRRDGGDIGWLAGALLPGYVTTVVVGSGGVENVAFAELGDDNRDDDLKALGLASAALRTGNLGFVDDDDVARLLDRADPTMSVLAAYALDRAGQEDDVLVIFERCRSTGGPVPFDVALLADAVADAGPRLTPGFPLMRRGWALADGLPAGEQWLARARPRLGRTAWTTFTALDTDAMVALGRSQQGVHA